MMDLLSIVLIAFIVLESLNVLMLYFTPNTKKGNGIGVFNAWEKSKKDSEVHDLVRYLVNWVAGTKIIFIGLLILTILMGSDTMKLYAVAVMIVTIGSFYWRLYPLIRRLDDKNQISPRGYSKTLGIMIGCFMLIFVLALVITIIL